MNKKHKYNNVNNPIDSFNNLNPNELPYSDDIKNIMNDSDSEKILKYDENIKTNKLKNDKEENISVYKTDPKLEYKKKETKQNPLSEINNNIKIEINKDNCNSNIRIEDNLDKLPKNYLFDKIKNEIFPKMNLKDEIKENFIFDENLQILEKSMSEETYYSKKTRKRGQLKLEEEKNNNKKGRKKNNEPSDGKHNKDSPDNIIKKIKSKLLDYLLKFINNLLKSLLYNKINTYIQIGKNEKEMEKEKIIKKIDYKAIVDDMKRENNLNLLDNRLQKILSNDITSKYSTLSKDLNKKIIDNILKEEKDNEIIMFVFKLTFREWFDIFTYKKEIKDFDILDDESINKIINHFERADKLLEDIYHLNYNHNYFSRFVILLYNYERWFFVKQGRKRKDKRDKKEDEK